MGPPPSPTARRFASRSDAPGGLGSPPIIDRRHRVPRRDGGSLERAVLSRADRWLSAAFSGLSVASRCARSGPGSLSVVGDRSSRFPPRPGRPLTGVDPEGQRIRPRRRERSQTPPPRIRPESPPSPLGGSAQLVRSGRVHLAVAVGWDESGSGLAGAVGAGYPPRLGHRTDSHVSVHTPIISITKVDDAEVGVRGSLTPLGTRATLTSRADWPVRSFVSRPLGRPTPVAWACSCLSTGTGSRPRPGIRPDDYRQEGTAVRIR